MRSGLGRKAGPNGMGRKKIHYIPEGITKLSPPRPNMAQKIPGTTSRLPLTLKSGTLESRNADNTSGFAVGSTESAHGIFTPSMTAAGNLIDDKDKEGMETN
jgi:hypothetical protein